MGYGKMIVLTKHESMNLEEGQRDGEEAIEE